MYPQPPREVREVTEVPLLRDFPSHSAQPSRPHPLSYSPLSRPVSRHRPYSTASFPWGSLMVGSVILGAIAAGSWQIWQFVAPMLEPPLPPQFDQAVAPPPAVPRPVARQEAPVMDEDESDPSSGPSPDGTFGPGSRGRVIEPIGLAIRGLPSGEGAYLGGIVMGETVTVLEVSGDGQWQRVRRELNGQEGWVRSGNLGSTTDPPPSQAAVPTPAPPVGLPPATPTPAPAPVIPVGSGQQGRVLVPIGLALRAQPDSGSPQVGGIAVNEVVTVLGTSTDGQWERVRYNGVEGWIRAGNLGAP